MTSSYLTRRMGLSEVVVGLLLVSSVLAQYGGGDTGGYSGSSSSNTGGSSAAGESGGYDYTSTPAFKKMSRITIIHATLASLAWVILFPLGSILLRLIHSKSSWKIHAFLQTLGLLVFIVAVGMGIWLSQQVEQYLAVWKDPHVIIGLIVFALAVLQPFFGWIHHVLFVRRREGKRTGWGALHVWIGRVLITLGIINGGLGLRLASNSPTQAASATRKAEIAYGVVAGVMFLLYVFVSVWSETRRAKEMNEREKRTRRTRRRSHHRENDGGARKEKRGKFESSSSDETLTEGGFRVYRTNSGPLVQRS